MDFELSTEETRKIIESLDDTGGFLIKGSELRHWVAHYVNKDRKERLSELPDAEEIYSLIDPCIVSRRQIAILIAKRIGKE